MTKKGKLIVIEGTDGSGKKTQKDLLVKRLNKEGIESIGISFPRYDTPTGKIVGECYLGKNLGLNTGSLFDNPSSLDPRVTSLYYAADRLAAKSLIEEKLESGIIIVSDRYVESNLGHQGGKIKDSNERCDLIKWIRNLEYDTLNLPKPFKVIFLHMPSKITSKLRENRNLINLENPDAHEGDLDHIRNTEQCYLELSRMFDWKKIYCTKKSNGNLEPKSIDDIHKETYSHISQVLNL